MSDPYRPPSAPVADLLEVSDEDFANYAGGNQYETAWIQFRATGGSVLGFHWPVFFVGTLWCVYRKMYLFGVILFFAGMLTSALYELAVELAEAPADDIRFRIGRLIVVFLAVRVPAALLANALYCRKAVKAIRAAPPGTAEERAAYLSRRGGTSNLALGLVVMLYAGLRLSESLLFGGAP